MDPATLIGVLAGLVIIVVANVMEGGDPTSLLLVPPMLLVFGTTLMVTMAGGTIPDAKHAMLSVKTAFTAKVRPAGDVVPMVVALAEKARREGLLARAPPGGAPADGSVHHRGAVPRAGAARVAGREDLAGVRAALGGGGLQDRLQCAVEAVDLRGGEAAGPRQG